MTKLGLVQVDGKVWMIIFVSKEQRYSGSSTQSVVIGKFHKRKQCILIVLLIVSKNL